MHPVQGLNRMHNSTLGIAHPLAQPRVEMETEPISSNLTIEKKKPKMHECEICGKMFPRPSGLQTHSNIHNNLKPFRCGFEGCTQAFAVRSNATRHLRTHGVEVAVRPRREKPTFYVVGFDTPNVLPAPPDETPTKRYKVRWTSPGLASRKYGQAKETRNERGF